MATSYRPTPAANQDTTGVAECWDVSGHIHLAGTVISKQRPGSDVLEESDLVAEGIIEPLGFVRMVAVPERPEKTEGEGWLTIVSEGGRTVYGSYTRTERLIDTAIEGGTGEFEQIHGRLTVETERWTGGRTRYIVSGDLHLRTHRTTTESPPSTTTVTADEPDRDGRRHHDNP